METFLIILPYLVTIVCSVLSGVFAYLIAIKQSKLDLNKETQVIKLDESKFIKQLHNSDKFNIYHELSSCSLKMAQDALFLFPPFLDQISENTEEKNVVLERRYKEACSSYDKFINCLNSNAPFIDEDVYNKFDELRENCRLQIIFYPDLVLINDPSFAKDYKTIRKECRERGKKLSSMMTVLISFLREKIKSDEDCKL